LTTLERLLSSTAVRNTAEVAAGAGDAPAAPPVVDESQTASAPAAPPESAATAVNPESATEPPKPTPWFMKRISDEAEAKNRAVERAEAAEKRAAEALAIAERLQRQSPGTYTPPPPPSALSHEDIMREAARMRLREDSTEVLNRGMAQFGPAFRDALAVLNAANVVNNDEFVADLIAVDRANAHVMLDRLAKEPERATSLASLPSRQRIAELTRMTFQQPEPRPSSPSVSRAPAPAPHVAPSSSNVRDWRVDDASDEEFDRGFRDMMGKRSRRR